MRVIIWGCGEIGKRIYKPLIDHYDVKVIAYTDNNTEITGGGVYIQCATNISRTYL